MILTDREIQAAIRNKQIIIEPEPPADNYSATTVDLTFGGRKVQRWKSDVVTGVEPPIINPGAPGYSYANIVERYTETITIDSNGHVLEPGDFILAWTAERLVLPVSSKLAGRVEGKSSLARLGVGVHVTAPTIHPGFDGELQLEIVNHSPLRIRLIPGAKVCQLIFETTLGTPDKGYSGQFGGQRA